MLMLSSPRRGYGKTRQTPFWVPVKTIAGTAPLGTSSFVSLHFICADSNPFPPPSFFSVLDLVLPVDGQLLHAPSNQDQMRFVCVLAVDGVFCTLLWEGCHPSMTVRTRFEELRGLGACPEVGRLIHFSLLPFFPFSIADVARIQFAS